MSQLVQPHGSDTLNILLLDGAEREQALAAARDLPRITLSSRERGDLIMLGIGGSVTEYDVPQCPRPADL